MKYLLTAVLLTIACQAQAIPTATPLWSCEIRARAVNDRRFFVLLRFGHVDAEGMMRCTAWNGQTINQPVGVQVSELGLGLGFSFPVPGAGLDFVKIKAGVSSPEAMYGRYAIQAGPGLTLVGGRLGADGALERTPHGEFAGNVQLKMEQMIGLGLDISGSQMTITPQR